MQEYCNALFDALFHILPLGTELDKVERTPAKVGALPPDSWDEAAQAELDKHVESEPFLVRISAAKRLRDRAEREALLDGERKVTRAHLARAVAEAG